MNCNTTHYRANSSSVPGDPTSLIRTLSTAEATRFDIGSASGPEGATYFVESAGVGFIGRMLRHPLSRGALIASAVRGALTGVDLDTRRARGVARLVRSQPLQRMAICADGEDLSGEYVAAEAMNIGLIGPSVRLAHSADPGDAMLDLVLIRAEDREALADRVERRATESEPAPTVIHRVREVEISWEPEFGHADDEPWPAGAAAGMVTIGIAGAVTVLRP